MGAGKGYFTDYPKHVGFILGNEFCERFSFYGMKAILVIFLTRALLLSEDTSTEIYHGFNMACYFTPLFGALLADGYLGHYKTIFSISIVYAIGNVIMAVGSVPFKGEDYIRALPFVGLTLIAIGTGGIKPCVAAFGADQFEDHQVRQKETFFSLFYMSINVGSLMSMIITPLIRSNINCFGDECYPLAFGIPAMLMIVSLILFLIGTRWYTINPPGDNIIGNLFGCIFTALKGKLSCGKEEGKREHWLDYADSKYEKSFISDVKIVMHVLFIFIPFPVFNALFDQQGSRWTLQAGRMNGDVGGFVIEPDLIQVVNPILVVFLVPLMESCLYPCLQKLKIPNSALQRMGVGMFLAGSAFIVSGLLQIAIDKSLPDPVPADHARFKVLNALPCDISGNVLDSSNTAVYNFSIAYDERTDVEQIDIPASNYTFQVEFNKCKGSNAVRPFSDIFLMENKESYNMIAYWDVDSKSAKLNQASQPVLHRTEHGKARLQFFNAWEKTQMVEVETVDDPVNSTHLLTSKDVELPNGHISIKASSETFEAITKAGAVYTGVFHYADITKLQKAFTQYQDIAPNSIHILYILPQYFVMTLGEVFFMVSGLSFAYSQSPASMKAVLQAAWLLTSSFGNLIVMIITAAGNMPNQMAEFFLYAGLMYVTTVIYVFMAMTYEYVKLEEPGQDGDLPSEKGSKKGSRDKEHNNDSFSERGSDDFSYDNLAMAAIEVPPKYETVADPDKVDTVVHF